MVGESGRRLPSRLPTSEVLEFSWTHIILCCHLLIDLKIRPFRHGDAGQMNFHLNYWKDQVMAEGDNPPVGLLLGTDKDQTKVEPSGARQPA